MACAAERPHVVSSEIRVPADGAASGCSKGQAALPFRLAGQRRWAKATRQAGPDVASGRAGCSAPPLVAPAGDLRPVLNIAVHQSRSDSSARASDGDESPLEMASRRGGVSRRVRCRRAGGASRSHASAELGAARHTVHAPPHSPRRLPSSSLLSCCRACHSTRRRAGLQTEKLHEASGKRWPVSRRSSTPEGGERGISARRALAAVPRERRRGGETPQRRV
ncbi:hypothetical protein FA09DRAFT_230170 [Tilletiopsis washingtonensis]|jgi:hypothetical protein|uniref:Uncharacterized protein n=1 Tax=Tilletiopsis washingtonensis TaxID=58919 RepID=A0A316ZER6_9BASI|nr:hypothetical protein FA09DRAFT_230170 [Tilletiopsis washingtonensis]PWN99412.1 hypothetical protein FA09DRAFT_230170 [Tilletiopsis washingtonensis]